LSQQWSEISVWFDDVGISAFHRYVVVDLWQSLSEWRLLLFECVLHHDNAPAHTTLSVSESPDIALSDFFMFPKIKEILK
jgi:hypothetical protein